MSREGWLGQVDLLVGADASDQERTIRQLSAMDALMLDADFETWAHDNQLEPTSKGWSTWLMMAGRGFGKTRAGSEWIFRLGEGKPGVRIALVGATMGDARTIMVEGVSGLIGVAARYGRRLIWEPSLGRLSWPNGSVAQLFSGDHADGLRGPEHDFAWCDELAKWGQAQEAWDNLQFAMRRGPRPRVLVTTTPRPMPLLKTIEERATTVTTRGRTSDNINVDEKVIALLTATYGGTRLGRQELDGELLTDVEGALWTQEMFARSRVAASAAQAITFDRIAVGVDPPAGEKAASDACGIVVAGSSEGKLYVLEDATVQGLSPEGWSSRVAAAAARWGAGLVVAEANNGGAMVASVLKAAELEVKVRLVHATKGKSARAEPIALKFETGRAFLAGSFPQLEAELGGIIAGGGYAGPGRSPDRADAMVWAMTVLGETRSGVPRVARL
ncbi:phage terminase large subunit-like protein [Sphingomonas sp. F9_3S_D5_B_2]